MSRSKLDTQHILQYLFDESTQRLKTDTTAVIETPPDGLAVDITHTNDSVRLGDGINLTTVTSVGSKKGLDVNIISGVELNLSAGSGDSVILSDGENDLSVNEDGSLNVNLVNSSNTLLVYDEVESVTKDSVATIINHTVTSSCKLKSITASGSNIATYQVRINGNVVSKKRTFFGNSMNTDFLFQNGLNLTSGDVVAVQVLHQRPHVGDFNASIIFER